MVAAEYAEYAESLEGKNASFKYKLLKCWNFRDKIASDHRQKAEKKKKRGLSVVSSVITSLF